MLDPTYIVIQETDNKELKRYLWHTTLHIMYKEHLNISEAFKPFIQKNINNIICINDITNFLNLRKTQKEVINDYYAIQIINQLEGGKYTSNRPLHLLLINKTLFDNMNHNEYNIIDPDKYAKMKEIIDYYEASKNQSRTYDENINTVVELVLKVYKLKPFEKYNFISCFVYLINFLQYHIRNVNYEQLSNENTIDDFYKAFQNQDKKLLETVIRMITKKHKKDIKIADVLKKLKTAPDDTIYSLAIFILEEGAEDNKIKESNIKNKRRDWLILADIYNEGQYTQKFHLQNYLKFKLNDGYKENESFYSTCYRYLKNAALILYINEVIFEETNESLENKYDLIVKRYTNDKNKINNSKLTNSIRL